MARRGLAFAILLSTACSTVHVRVPLSSEDAASANKELASANKQPDGGIARVKLHGDEQESYGRDFWVTPSSVSWTLINPDGTRTSSRRTVPPAALDRIVSRQYERGAFDGFLVGAGLGAGGALFALTRYPVNDSGPIVAIGAAILSAAAVGGVGALFGALIGHSSTVEFTATPSR